ncbi:hypothetical protein CERSUDRAFT_91340 [Gelatoporia subvermispora B]|uniref:Zona occludens toxin N-terminal domain-containing protein n=1 Tax=Ceriporiopsis subvermispora (strain B) TaxID=914234 RepID=M2R857_CERS8|nr:hypothetical protein CERSUDRAFT_91340 [Gelatoporia subvermispora B]
MSGLDANRSKTEFTFNFGATTLPISRIKAAAASQHEASTNAVIFGLPGKVDKMPGIVHTPPTSSAFQELQLLNHAVSTSMDTEEHDVKTAPIMTRPAYLQGGLASQYGVLGSVISVRDETHSYTPTDPRLYINTNAPFSAIVCGVQGAGKSHTVSVILESMLIPQYPAIGACEKPLCGLVLHYSEGGANARPNEAAWLGCAAVADLQTPPVVVYVSRSSLRTMKQVYAPLGDRVKVKALLFSEEELDAEAFLSMMAVGSSDSAPLYVQTMLSILRDLGEDFSYNGFLSKMEGCKQDFNPAQLAGLKQRLALLESFIDTTGARQKGRFKAGQLTNIDLSDPFIDSAAACGIFEIITRLFIRADVETGKVMVVDEAHKYLDANRGKSGLTKALLSLIRQQRHLAMRVIISTQEPTVVPPVLLDLCNITIIHRFSSPSWWEHLAKHVSAKLSDDAFDRLIKLSAGEALVLASSGLDAVKKGRENGNHEGTTLQRFGRRYLLVKTRKRVTADGGASVLVL